MIKWLLKFLKRPKPKKVFPSLKLANRFMLTAVAFFCLQSIIATFASVEFIFPALPTPIPFNVGRSIHLNLSIFWPLFGLIGATYFFYIIESEVDLYSTQLAKLQFWLLLLSFLGILGTLLLGMTTGREYLEAILPFKVAVAVDLGLVCYNLWRTRKQKGARKSLISLVMLLGIVSSLIFFVPNLVNFSHIVTDEIVKFWVVHLWEELSFELIGAGIISTLILQVTNTSRKQIEAILVFDATLMVLAGLLATGHHYYWLGTPRWWLYIGGVFSLFQLGPIILLALPLVKGFLHNKLESKYKLVFYYLVSSVFWHFTGAGLLGLLISVPQLNRYLRGTLVTSSHSHMAVFGVFGLFVLGLSIYILAYGKNVKPKAINRYLLSLVLLNAGLALMGLALSIGGLVQVYLSRIAGMEFMRSLTFMQPYMISRTIGALCFTSGALIFGWETWRLERD